MNSATIPCHPKAKTVFPHALAEDDAKRPWTEQTWIHHRLFYDLFKPGVSRERISRSIPRLHAFIELRTKTPYPTTMRDITGLAMRKFFVDDWPSGREEIIAGLLMKYLKASYLDVNSTTPLHSIGESDAKQVYGDRPLLQQVLDMSSSSGLGYTETKRHHLIQALVDAGADLSSVPSVDLKVDNMNFSGVIKKGDILAYTSAKYGDDSQTTLLVKTAVMHSGIKAAQHASQASASSDARPRRLGL